MQTTKSYELVGYNPPTYSDGKVSPGGRDRQWGVGLHACVAAKRAVGGCCRWLLLPQSWLRLRLPLAAAAPLKRRHGAAVVELHPFLPHRLPLPAGLHLCVPRGR